MSLMTIEPCSGFSRPTRDFRNTDLPVPDGPSITEISPGGRVRVTSLQMFWLPKDFVSPSTCTATPTSTSPNRLRCPPVVLMGNDEARDRLRGSRGGRDAGRSAGCHLCRRTGLDVQ